MARQEVLGLVPIPGGTIAMRDARSATTRDVMMRPFSLGRTQLTRADWSAVMDDAGTPPSLPRQPMQPLTWFDAVVWCNAASGMAGLPPAYDVDGPEVRWDVGSEGYRLPTEAEWEWAARAGTTTPRYGPLADIAWTAADGLEGPAEVAGKVANEYGLFDMIGNVWEWCWDYADTARYGDYRSLRGAGWDDPHWSARASVRRGSAPDALLEDVGFRVARGAVGVAGTLSAQGWSAKADKERASIKGPRPVGWTPLRGL